jgi:hypothetical protein
MEYALSSTNLVISTTKEAALAHFWPNETFGDLMRGWLNILRSAGDKVEQLSLAISRTQAGSHARVTACKKLATVCDEVYKKVLESGFHHRKDIRRYSQWEDVMRATEPRTWRSTRK